jgi:hypothetical protein
VRFCYNAEQNPFRPGSVLAGGAGPEGQLNPHPCGCREALLMEPLEYLTVEFSLVKKPPLIFRFADNSTIKANHLHEFLNRQAAQGWELLTVLPLTYVAVKTSGQPDGLLMNCCRLIFRGPIWPNAHNGETDPPLDEKAPGPRLKPV